MQRSNLPPLDDFQPQGDFSNENSLHILFFCWISHLRQVSAKSYITSLVTIVGGFQGGALTACPRQVNAPGSQVKESWCWFCPEVRATFLPSADTRWLASGWLVGFLAGWPGAKF